MAIITSISPNIESDDVRGAWRALFSFWRWRDERIIEKAQSRLSGMFNGREVVLVSSGRAAIYRVLKSFGIGKGDEVIVQAFTCLAVPSPVKWVGAKPVYADIDPTNYNFDVEDVKAKISPKTKAIVIQHTFGIPGPVKEIKALAEENGLFLIEDLAHGFGAKADGQKVGTFGDAAILSFGRDKALSSVFGGAVVSDDSDLVERVRDEQRKLKPAPFWWIKQQLLHPLITSLAVRLYFVFGAGKVLLVVSQKMKLLSLAVGKKERVGVMPGYVEWRFAPALGILLLKQLEKVDRFVEHRRKLARLYDEAVSERSWSDVAISNAGWLRFPVKVKNPQTVINKAKEHKILLGDWYNSPVAPLGNNESLLKAVDFEPGSCPKAEYTAKHTVNLPTGIKVSRQDAKKVADLVKEFSMIDHDNQV